MHILFDARIHFPYMSGISRYMLLLLEHLFKIDPNNRYTVLVNPTLPPDDAMLQLIDRTPNAEYSVVHLGHMGPVNYLKMPAVIKRFRPDVYHYPNMDAPLSGVPTVATIHDAAMSNGVKRFDDFMGVKAFYFRYSMRTTLKKANRALFISHAVKKEILDDHGLPDDGTRYKVVYNGFEADDFTRGTDQAQFEQVKRELQLPENYFLYVGALREHKNIARIIEAFSRLNLPGWQLITAGSRYEKFKVDLDRPGVRYLGLVPDEVLKALYFGSRGFIFPSLFEGFGFPILEAMSLGCPVVTTHYGATKEVAGDAALLVNPLEVDDIVAAMRRLAQEPALVASLREKGLRRCRDFSWETTARQTLATYEEIALRR
jgi:glycosyltransferase involved in cell wall biosynthesis